MGCFGLSDPNKLLIQRECMGKTEEQKKVINYFLKEGGCLSKRTITDEEYENLVNSKIRSMNFTARALKQIGLDETEVNEIEPLLLGQYFYDKGWHKAQKTGRWVSSAYLMTQIFFSATQIYLYRCQFNMDSNDYEESTYEIFYKDITSISTRTETENPQNYRKRTVMRLYITAPEVEFYVPLPDTITPEVEARIQGMKQKIREKKM